MYVTNVIVWIVAIEFLLYHEIAGYLTTDEKKCLHIRTNKMLKGRCYDMNLREVPQFLKSNIDILDVSFNRIKKLNRTSFQRYAGIRYLLLYDNMIQIVEPGTFSYLTSLEEIDISNNALLTIPGELFQLSSLRNLYVDSNELISLDDTLKTLQKPIMAPLEYLNVANCGLQKIPDLGSLPYLWHLNASVNPLQEATAQSFTSMCHIRSVDLTKTNIPPCMCTAIVAYLENLGLNLANSIDCDIVDKEICNATVFQIDRSDFETCNSVLLNKKSQNLWIIISSFIGGCLLIFICVLCWYHRKNRTKRARQQANHVRRALQENSNLELLRNGSK